MIEDARQQLLTAGGNSSGGGHGGHRDGSGGPGGLVLQELLGEGSFGKVHKALCEWARAQCDEAPAGWPARVVVVCTLSQQLGGTHEAY